MLWTWRIPATTRDRAAFADMTDPARARTPRAVGSVTILLIVVLGMTACGAAAGAPPAVTGLVAVARTPVPAATVLAGRPAVLTAEAAARLFRSAPVVVVASGRGHAAVAIAASLAQRAHAPLLLSSPRLPQVVRDEIRALHPRAILAVGLPAPAIAAVLPRIRVVTDPAQLPATTAPPPLGHVVLLLRQGDSAPATAAVVSSAITAGAQVIAVDSTDPRADPAAIATLAAARPVHVLAIGASFGPASRLAARVAVAATGVQLPGGGQVLFPGHRLVALYGYPGSAVLGALGEQGLTASIQRARTLASAYRSLSSVPVVPAFEIIATVAQASPGRDGTYSYESPVATLRPWVRRATAAGMYVVLDLQPGRANLLAQARKYQPLLRLPDVGLALDAEWKLQPGQRPLHQIGSVSIGEVNSVVRWLARLTARNHLPQKLLVLHQFRLSMIIGEQRLDTRHDDLAIVIHMDGQGTPADKQQTWDAVTGTAPPRVFFGWKNFFVKDTPMLGPQQTMARTPAPVMISYQ